MSVRNLECQIAKAQISRYLAGDPLSSEAVGQLEEHIAECPDCQDLVAQRRTALRAMLGSETQPAVTTRRSVRRQAASSGRAVIDLGEDAPRAARKKAEEPEDEPAEEPSSDEPAAPAKPRSRSWRPIAYSGALAAVLVGMSYLVKGPGSPLGPKAADVASTKAATAAATAYASPKDENPVKEKAAKKEEPTELVVAAAGDAESNDLTTILPNSLAQAAEPARSENPRTVEASPPASKAGAEAAKPDSPVEETTVAPAKRKSTPPRISVTRKPVLRRRFTIRRKPRIAQRRRPQRSAQARPASTSRPGARGIIVYDSSGNRIN